MASLRARLLAAVLVLGAVGLLLLGAVTYAEQRSFLLDRVDQQARSAPPAVAGALSGDGSGPARGDRDHDHGGPGPDLRLPSGTYGEERDAAGKTIGSPIVFGYTAGVTADPKLPKDIPIGKPITVDGEEAVQRLVDVAHRDRDDGRARPERVALGEDAVVVAVAVLAVDGDWLADGDVLRQLGVGRDARGVSEHDRRADGLARGVALLAVRAGREVQIGAARPAAAIVVAVAAGRAEAVA